MIMKNIEKFFCIIEIYGVLVIMKKLKKNIYFYSILIVIFSIFTVYSNANMPMVIKEITDILQKNNLIKFLDIL